jgi:hypothetical protein
MTHSAMIPSTEASTTAGQRRFFVACAAGLSFMIFEIPHSLFVWFRGHGRFLFVVFHDLRERGQAAPRSVSRG